VGGLAQGIGKIQTQTQQNVVKRLADPLHAPLHVTTFFIKANRFFFVTNIGGRLTS
jgi:hypothetical protein